MRAENSLVHAYLDRFPATRKCVHGALNGDYTDGSSLVDDHLAPMMDWVFERITENVCPDRLTAPQALMFIEELWYSPATTRSSCAKPQSRSRGRASSWPTSSGGTTWRRGASGERSRPTMSSTQPRSCPTSASWSTGTCQPPKPMCY
jgi:hypothetical protein